MVRPRSSALVMSSFAVCVIDQQRPWLTPRSTVAATIQFQSGAYQIITGIGSATTQPKASRRLRPIRSDQHSATKFITALTAPKAQEGGEQQEPPTLEPEFAF